MWLHVSQMELAKKAFIKASEYIVENIEVSLMRKIKSNTRFFKHKVIDFSFN